MNINIKSRVGAVVASAGVLTGALTLGLANPASASSVPAFELRVCSRGDFHTTAYHQNGQRLNVPAQSCRSVYWQPWGPNPSLAIRVETYAQITSAGPGGTGTAPLRYIAGATVDIAKGAGLATGGTASQPYLWSF